MNQMPPMVEPSIPTTTYPEQIIPSSPKRSTPFLPILFTFLITTTLFIGGYFGYQQFKVKPSIPAPSPTASTEILVKDDPTADWIDYKSPLFSYNFKYPSTWNLLTFEKNNSNAIAGSNSLQNYSPIDVEQFMDHGEVNWSEYIKNKAAIKIDYAVYSKKTGPNQFLDKNIFLNGLLSKSAKKLPSSDLTIGGLNTIQYKQTADLGPTDIPEINTYIAYPTDNEIIYINLFFWNKPSYEVLKTTAEWQELSQILSTFKFNSSSSEESFVIEAVKNHIFSYGKAYGLTSKDQISEVVVHKIEGNYARGVTGSVPHISSGSAWFAKKINGVWIIIEETQEPPSCQLMAQHQFPKSIYEDCIEK